MQKKKKTINMRLRSTVFILISVLCMTTVLAACGTNQAQDDSASQTKSASAGNTKTSEKSSKSTTASDQKNDSDLASDSSSENQQTHYPLKVADASGLTMTFKQAPNRIISLAPSETEILFALGLGDKVVGVSPYDTYPKEALKKPKIGTMQGNGETILQAQPDVVFTGLTLSGKAVQQLRKLNVRVFTVEPKNLDKIMQTIQTIGIITNRQKQAAQVIMKMKKQQQQVMDAIKNVSPDQKKKVYLEFSPGWTVGSGEYLNNLLNMAGGINIADAKKGWYPISEEKIVKDNPDVILYAKGVQVKGKFLKQLIEQRSGWSQITAIKNDQVIGLDQDILSRPGPRATQALYNMAKAIYPELVK